MWDKERRNVTINENKSINPLWDKKEYIVLGLESSCDETAASVVRNDSKILSNVISSQFETHRPYGGVVPELAARAHVDKIDQIVEEAMRSAQITYSDLSAIAATGGPGLIGGVLVGTTFGKALAFANNLPFIAVNHLEGHALTPRLTHYINFPYLLLLASGGHCQLLTVKGVGEYELLGSTIDDAIGEAFDKTAKLLGLGFPGGPALEKIALNGDGKTYNFPKPLAGRPGCDFSFSGLKTAVRYTVDNLPELTKQNQADLAASFQETVVSILNDRCANAISIFQEKIGSNGIFVAAGGVAANMQIRNGLTSLASDYNMEFIAPPLNLCTDNAAMIAWAGLEKLKMGHCTNLDFAPRPRWPLNEL